MAMTIAELMRDRTDTWLNILNIFATIVDVLLRVIVGT